jgi:hypothetical protein
MEQPYDSNSQREGQPVAPSLLGRPSYGGHAEGNGTVVCASYSQDHSVQASLARYLEVFRQVLVLRGAGRPRCPSVINATCERFAFMDQARRVLGIAGILVIVAPIALSQTQQSQTPICGLSPTTATNDTVRSAIREVVLNAGERQVSVDAVKQWRGNKQACTALVEILHANPADSQDWRNAIQALTAVTAANTELAKSAFQALKDFEVNDLRYHSSVPVSPTDGPMSFEYAAFLAKTEVPNAFAELARDGPKEVAEEALALLTQEADPAYWKTVSLQWPSDRYPNPAAREVDLAVLSVRALGKVCNSDSRKKLKAVDDLIQRYKTQPDGRLGDNHLVWLELQRIPKTCGE